MEFEESDIDENDLEESISEKDVDTLKFLNTEKKKQQNIGRTSS
jgi:hypothetical protein